MTINPITLLEVLQKSSLSDDQIDEFVDALRIKEDAAHKGAPDTKILDFEIKRLKILFGTDWRSPPSVPKEPGPLETKYRKMLARTGNSPSSKDHLKF